VIQAEAASQCSLDYALLAKLYSVIATGNFDEQKGERESGIMLIAGLTAIIETGQKPNQPVEHCPSLAV
jgi:hypothetical protein